MSQRSWTIILEEDGEDLILPLSNEILKSLDWAIGDTINWIDNNDGTFTLKKKSS